MVEIMQGMQQRILVKLIHNPGLSFNELWAKEDESNKFNYHLKSLLVLNLIVKRDGKYYLTNKGLTYVSGIDGATGSKKRVPIVCAFVLGYDAKSDEILVNIRKKEPFYDYAGIPGGKIEFGASPKKSAEIEFLEETGLKGELLLAGVSNYNTYNDGDLMHHVIAFTYVCKNPRGELVSSNREGNNVWMSFSQLKNNKRYPEIDYFIETILESQKAGKSDIHYFNVNRFQEDGVFKSIEILNHF